MAGIEETDLSGVKINGKSYMSPYTNFRFIWSGPQVWMWNEFVKNPEALAEYFEEGRYPAGAWENGKAVQLDYQVRRDFYLKLDYAKRALEIAYDVKYIREELLSWFLKFWRAYKEPIEKVFPQFDDRSYANPTLLERLAEWCANTVANTFVKYGPNAFFVLVKGILTGIKIDNGWMEALKSLSKEYPELLDYDEFKRIIQEELPKSDELYYELKDFYAKWYQKYEPKDEMTRARLDLLGYLYGGIQGKAFHIAKDDFYKELAKDIVHQYTVKYLSNEEANRLFKELHWALEYLWEPNQQIAPSEYFVGTNHVTWDYMHNHQPKVGYSYGI
ncbi:hypothetical protein [Desulfurobacterium sp.]|uniref:hypothetical protein n=1 Tax=Desulfurobacterium sp. TaxID=2004706 RepID=UPI002638593C|nr:hypothetical protein [Desulfurobacterium sp.]